MSTAKINNDIMVMMFCAGLGTRISKWTKHHPKAMLPVNRKTLIERNIKFLQSFGLNKVVINLHHFSEQLRDFVSENKAWGSEILFSDESAELLETGGGLLHAEKLFSDAKIVVTCNVDILTDLNVAHLLHHHLIHKPLITLSVGDRESTRKFMFNKKNELCGWENNKIGETIYCPNRYDDMSNDETTMAFNCFAVYHKNIFEHMKSKLRNLSNKFSLTDLYLELSNEHPILAYKQNPKKIIDVGKPDSIKIAESMFE